MSIKTRCLLVVILALLALAVNVQARIYTVTLADGSTFETRYPPVVFDDDPEVSQLLTDQGTWIGVKTREIADVASRDDDSGFGHEVDTTTRFLGWILVEETPEPADDAETAARYELPEPADRETYSIERFLQPRASNPSDPQPGIPLDLFYRVYDFGTSGVAAGKCRSND